MKKLILLLFAVLLSFGIRLSVSAQGFEGDILLEGGVGYGSEINSFAVQTGGLYRINEEFRGEADIIYYFPGEDVRGLEFSWFEFNVNGHYFFVDQENIAAYALTGLNFTKLFSEHSGIELSSGDSTEKIYMGLNIGGGVDIPAGALNVYVEGKYALSSAHQLAVTGGVRIPIGNK